MAITNTPQPPEWDIADRVLVNANLAPTTGDNEITGVNMTPGLPTVTDIEDNQDGNDNDNNAP